MKITICSSLDFTDKVKEVADQLAQQNYKVTIPQTSERILNGEVTFEQIMKEKETGGISDRIIKYNCIKYYFEKIKEADAVLVLNLDKKGIKNYIGGAVFLEMGFAHILNKQIFLLNKIPQVSYEHEIKGMQPIVLNGDLNKIKEI